MRLQEKAKQVAFEWDTRNRFGKSEEEKGAAEALHPGMLINGDNWRFFFL